jgi:hypothetical protein
VTKSAPHTALKLIVWGKLTFDERVIVHRMEGRYERIVNRGASRPVSCPVRTPNRTATYNCYLRILVYLVVCLVIYDSG